MDILKPELVWVDGRCYRVLENTNRTNDVSPYFEDNNYQLDDKDAEDEYDSNIEIIPYGSAKFKHSFHVPKYKNYFLSKHTHAHMQ